LFTACDPILLVGQDLALTGSQYYIESAPDGETRIELTGSVGRFHHSSAELRRAMHEVGNTPLGQDSVQRFVRVPGWHGGEVMTSLQFDAYRRWFGQAALDQRGRARIVNCSEGGARIDHMEHMPLAEALAGSPARQLDSKLLASLTTPPMQRRRAVEQMIRELQRALSDCEQELTKCDRLARQALASGDLSRLERAEQKLSSVVQGLPFVTALVSSEVELARREAANALNLAQALGATSRLYAAIREAVGFSRPLLSASLARVRR
jgi:hypothetical protein